MTALHEPLADTEAPRAAAGPESAVVAFVTRLLGGAAKGRDVQRLVRYAVTSVVALAVSELCLVVVDADTGIGAMLAAFVANLAGTIPSYLMSRYWIWSEADRSRPARQVLLYWLTSLVSMVISSVSTGAISDADHAHHVLKLLLLGAVYLFVSLILWVAKYVAYQTVIFQTPQLLDDAPADSPA